MAHATGALKARDMERVTVDTTVQPKNITHPTDTKLMHKAIVMLGALARKHGVKLRQSYVRVAKQAATMAGRNYLKGRHGDQANAVLTATGHNLRLVLRWLRKLLCKIPTAPIAAIWPVPAPRTVS